MPAVNIAEINLSGLSCAFGISWLVYSKLGYLEIMKQMNLVGAAKKGGLGAVIIASGL